MRPEESRQPMRQSSFQKNNNSIKQPVSRVGRFSKPVSTAFTHNRDFRKDQQMKRQSTFKPKRQIIKQDCLVQNKKFKLWAAGRKWGIFHSSHYDWWAFPIDTPSGSYGSAYKVESSDLPIMRNDEEFLKALKENATLVCWSWGWDLEKGEHVKHPDEDQIWQRWPIRLSKMCRSLQIFSEGHKDIHNLFANAIKYSMIILQKYKKLTYGGKDLSTYFIQNDKKLRLQSKQQWMQKEQEKKQEESTSISTLGQKRPTFSSCCK